MSTKTDTEAAERAMPVGNENASRESRNCQTDGEHCFCVEPYTYVHGMDINKAFCCWCEQPKCITKSWQRVPGHGKYRTELVRE